MLHEDRDTFTSNNYFDLITNMTVLFLMAFLFKGQNNFSLHLKKAGNGHPKCNRYKVIENQVGFVSLGKKMPECDFVRCGGTHLRIKRLNSVHFPSSSH